MGNVGKFRWIDESIEIDFPLPAEVQELIAEIEQHDLDGNLGQYIGATDFLDAYAKRWIGDGLTSKQYDMLCYKYR